MRIGFDAKKIVSNMTGIGNYSRGLVNLLSADGADSCVLFAPGQGKPECRRLLVENDNTEYRFFGGHGALQREYWRNRGIVKDIRESGVELFHGLSNELPWGIEKAGIPTAVTIHDLIFLRIPEMYGAADRMILKLKTKHACRVATRIAAMSEQTKRDLVDFYGVDPARIDVLYQGCDAGFKRRVGEAELQTLREKYDLPERYIIAVGTIEERKNQLRLVEAFSKIGGDTGLVIVSRRTPMQEAVEKRIRELGIGDRVRILNGIPFGDLPGLYQGSAMSAYMSRFEGFGIPVLEGITSRVPVLAATGSCLEEAGGPGAVYADPLDVDGIAEKIREVLDDTALRERLLRGGEEHLKRFADATLRDEARRFYARVAADFEK